MSKASAMGIIFANLHDANVAEIAGGRTMASVPFAGRYRMVDFCLSGMARAGMHNIGVMVRRNYQSLMDHLGNGREWDLSRKRGGLVIFPPHDGDSDERIRQGRMETLNQAMGYLTYCTEELAVLSDCDIAHNLDFSDVLNAHVDSGADITAVYDRGEIAGGLQSDNVVFLLDSGGCLSDVRVNDYQKGTQNLSMHIYVMRRELLVQIVKDAIVRGMSSFETDFLAKSLNQLKVQGYEYTGYRARIHDMQSYFAESLRLLEGDNLSVLFPPGRPVYTKVRDTAPARYAMGSSVANSLFGDGCVIEGRVENCVLFRNVHVGKGALLQNCVVMQGSVIEAGAQMANVVTDKNVTVCAGRTLCGAGQYPVFISKGSVVE